MAEQKQPFLAKCLGGSFESNSALSYAPNLEYRIIYDEKDRTSPFDINLANRHQRQLVYGKTLGGKWTFEFDRANSSSTAISMFFCKACGQPFDRLSDLGNHSRSEEHSQDDIIVKRTKAEDDDTEEQRLLAERRAAEEQVEVTR